MDKKITSAGQSLLRTVAKTDLEKVISGVAEVALDRNLVEGVLKDLPVVGILFSLARAGQSISDGLFVRQLERFLVDLQAVPVEERLKLLEKYPDGSEEQSVLGENLLLAIGRLDDVSKPTILARFFTAFSRSEIDYTTFTRLTRALEKFNMELLPNLRYFYTGQGAQVDMSEEITHELSSAGLVLAELSGSGTIGGSAGYRQCSVGKLFLSIGFDTQSWDT